MLTRASCYFQENKEPGSRYTEVSVRHSQNHEKPAWDYNSYCSSIFLFLMYEVPCTALSLKI